MNLVKYFWSNLPKSIWVPLSAYYSAFTHIQLVTKAPSGAWLFRAGGPWSFPYGLLGSAEIDPGVLSSALQRASSQGNVPGLTEALPESARLLDINLLTGDCPEESRLVDLEADFFRSRPDLGDFMHWPLRGLQPQDLDRGCRIAGLQEGEECPNVTLQPQDAGEGLRNRLALSFASWDPDSLGQKVNELHDLVQRRQNTAIFFHCSCGCDRTGELVAAYGITYLNWTAQAALQHNIAVAGRPMWYQTQISVQWYCEWLKSMGKYHHGDCGGCGGRVRCFDDGFVLDPGAESMTFSILTKVCILSVISLAMICGARRVWRSRLDSASLALRSPFLEAVSDEAAILTPQAGNSLSNALANSPLMSKAIAYPLG